MCKLLKEKFFFLIDKEEKEFIRQKVMNSDHKVIQSVIGIIALIETVVLILNLLKVAPTGNEGLEIASCALYISLISICLICLVCLSIFKRKGKPFPYFIFITIFTFALMLWGAGISIIVSYDSFTILYYVLTIVAASALICLEPWVETLCVVLASIIYVIFYYSLDGIQRTSDLIFISGVLLAMVISLVCFYFNFHRRTKAISQELEITKLNEQLDNKANTDRLTGVNNRLFLSERLENKEDKDFTNGGSMMFDLDDFKNVNDTYGHMAGDKCLSEVGKCIREITDGKDGFSVRYGGEEFFVYIKNTNKDELFALGESLREAISNIEIDFNNQKIKFTVSVGLSMGGGKDHFEQLIDEADKALYKAKETKNVVKFVV